MLHCLTHSCPPPRTCLVPQEVVDTIQDDQAKAFIQRCLAPVEQRPSAQVGWPAGPAGIADDVALLSCLLGSLWRPSYPPQSSLVCAPPLPHSLQELLDDAFLQPPRKSQESELRRNKSDAATAVRAARMGWLASRLPTVQPACARVSEWGAEPAAV